MPDLADLYPGYASRWNHAANGRIFARAGVDPLSCWRAWAPDVSGFAIASGHYLAEENPATTAQALLDFFGTG
ncbi:MAG: hypothetical protein WA280_01120 [Xanthobacteraceae bacterium]